MANADVAEPVVYISDAGRRIASVQKQRVANCDIRRYRSLENETTVGEKLILCRRAKNRERRRRQL